ncbi:CinA family protein [Microbacterium pseudoresistens]|uniref:Nicotinamide-nucleotide amidase n=1 Tax=Microbacterium pseudoresistens TaxID=640634 RepID=A0A7Y9EWD2_9MICO|nr:CinA family protein [Microbacterium pseudoresistens]NYD55143.1 nicotinamide-nucleotide amidase [Microbacterium pseudoresistens]
MTSVDDASSLAPRVLAALNERGWTLGVAESLTGGALVSALVSVPGASDVVAGGVVAYATPLKHTLLGVDAGLLDEHGPVHPEVAGQMAAGVRSTLAIDGREADAGLSTTGIAGPDSPDGQPVGTVHIGVSTPEGSEVRSHVFRGDRASIRSQSVDAALVLLADHLARGSGASGE